MLIGPIHNLSKQHKHHKSDSNPKQTIRPKKTLNKQKRGYRKGKKNNIVLVILGVTRKCFEYCYLLLTNPSSISISIYNQIEFLLFYSLTLFGMWTKPRKKLVLFYGTSLFTF